MPLVRVQVLVDEGLAAALRAEAGVREVPVSQVARKVLQLGWAAHGVGWRPPARPVTSVRGSAVVVRDELDDIA